MACAGGVDVLLGSLKPTIDEPMMTELIARCTERRCMTIRMVGGSIDFEADSAASICDLLGAGCDAWRKRQCVDRHWVKTIASKNFRGNASKFRLRFVSKGAAYLGRASFSILKQKLSAGPEVELEGCEVEWVSACRKGSDGEPEALVHWAGGVEEWGVQARTWQALDRDTVLAVWEKRGERESIEAKLQGGSCNTEERGVLESELADLPKAGSSGIVACLIRAEIRSQCFQAKVLECDPRGFKLEFEHFKTGVADPDDGIYDLMDAQVDWSFTNAPGTVVDNKRTRRRE